MGVRGGLSVESMRRIHEIAAENTEARKLLYLLCQEDRQGGRLLDALEAKCLKRNRIEHLYNALGRNNEVFVNYVYLIQKTCSKDEIQRARYLDEYMALVKRLEPKYIQEYGKSPNLQDW